MNSDVRRIYVAQGLRAFVYGFGAVLLGSSLDSAGWSGAKIGLLLTAVVAGTAITTVLVGTFGDRIGRRRCYVALFVALSVTGVVFAQTEAFAALALVALAGALSTEVVESGPFT